MSITDPKIEAMRAKWLALDERKRAEAYQKRKAFFYFQPKRFPRFELRIQQCERARVRFAVHAQRVECAGVL